MILTVLSLTLVSSGLAQQPADKNVQQRTVRQPQGQIQYTNPDGLKVDWKIYGTENQAHDRNVEARRSQRAETNHANHASKVQPIQSPIEQQPHYQPYAAVPDHIKQLIVQAYSQQGPHVDPGAFFYKAPAISTIASAVPQSYNEKSDLTRSSDEAHSYFNSATHYRASGLEQTPSREIFTQSNKIGGIKYKNEERVYQRSAELPYGSVLPTESPEKSKYQPYKHIQQSRSQFPSYNKQIVQPQRMNEKNFEPQQSSVQRQFSKQNSPSVLDYQKFDKQSSQPNYHRQMTQSQTGKLNYHRTNYEQNMSTAIQTLLKYQAQLPYNVIANHIHYRPKHIFVPKPLPESAKSLGNYPNKIYFVKTDGEIYEGPEIKANGNFDKRY